MYLRMNVLYTHRAWVNRFSNENLFVCLSAYNTNNVQYILIKLIMQYTDIDRSPKYYICTLLIINAEFREDVLIALMVTSF